jgi:hypothetical protein
MKRWMQKVGYYKLKKQKIIKGDWMVIIDASIQMGDRKCLVVLGCPMDQLPSNRALNLKDLTPLSLKVVKGLNAEVVEITLNEVNKIVGNVASINSDRGSDMLRGIKDFKKTNINSRMTFDTSHRVANFLKAQLKDNQRWQEFRKAVTQARRKMQNSKIACAMPPSPREKARFMNVGTLIEWAANMVILLTTPDSLPSVQLTEYSRYLGWLLEYEADIIKWLRLTEIGKRSRNLVRTEGLHINLADRFVDSIADLPLEIEEKNYSDQIFDFFLEQTRGLKPSERHNGSSEVIESFFGRLKSMEQEQTVFGFTSLVLAALAHVGPLNYKMVGDSISTVKLSDINDWSDEEIGVTVQAEKRQLGRYIAAAKLRSGTKHSGSIEGEAAGF